MLIELKKHENDIEMFATYNTHCFELIFIFFDEKKTRRCASKDTGMDLY